MLPLIALAVIVFAATRKPRAATPSAGASAGPNAPPPVYGAPSMPPTGPVYGAPSMPTEMPGMPAVPPTPTTIPYGPGYPVGDPVQQSFICWINNPDGTRRYCVDSLAIDKAIQSGAFRAQVYILLKSNPSTPQLVTGRFVRSRMDALGGRITTFMYESGLPMDVLWPGTPIEAKDASFVRIL